MVTPELDVPFQSLPETVRRSQAEVTSLRIRASFQSAGNMVCSFMICSER